MSYTVTIEFTSATKTYTILDAGFSFTERVGAKGQHATQSIALEVNSREASALFLTESKRFIDCAIKNDSTTIFEGVARPFQSVSASGNREDNFSFEVMDYTELMEDDATEASYYDSTVSEVISALLTMAGITGKTLDIDNTFGAKVLHYVFIDSSKSILTNLKTLLFEHGYDFRFSPGTVHVIPTAIYETPETAISDIRGTLKIERGDDLQNGIRASYNQYQANGAKDVTLYAPATIRYDYGLGFLDVMWTCDQFGGNGIMYFDPDKGRFIMKGNVSPNSRGSAYIIRDTSVNKNSSVPTGKGKISWNTQNLSANHGGKNIKIVNVSNIRFTGSMVDELGVNCTYTVQSYDTEGCVLKVGFDGTFQNWFGVGWGWNLKVVADVKYLVGEETDFKASEEEVAGRKTTEVTLDYVTESTDAAAYAQREYDRQKAGALKFSFQSLAHYDVGGFYKLTDSSVTGLEASIRILTCKKDYKSGVYSITAEGAKPVSTAVEIEALARRDVSGATESALRVKGDVDRLIGSQNVAVKADGLITTISSDDITYKWYINGIEQSETGLDWTIPYNSLATGNNTITVKCFVSGYTDPAREASYTVEKVSVDAEAKSISIISSASAITKNNRETGSKNYTFTAKVQGYAIGDLRWYQNDSESPIPNTNGQQQITISVAYKDAQPQKIAVRIDGDDTAYDSVTLSVVDETEAPKYRGKAGTSAELTVIEADVIDGDGFLAVADFGGYYTEGIPYIYRDELNKDGRHWFAQAEINADNSSMFMAILQDASSITNLNSDAFTWIGKLLANEAVIDSLFANTIQIQKSIYSGSYNKDGQTSSDSKGFYADKDGTLKATEATFKNANISEMTASDVNIVRGKISGITSVEANVGRFDSVKGSLDLDALKTYEDATGITFNDSAPRDILQVSDIMSVMPDYSLKTPALQTGNITYRGATYTEYACQRMSAGQLHRGTASKKYTTNGWNGYDGFNDWAYPFAIGSNGASGGSNVFVSVKDIIQEFIPDLWTEIDNAGHWDQLFYIQLRASSGQSFYVYANGSSSYSYKSSPSDSIIFRGWMRATDTLKVYIKDSAISGYRDHYLRVSVNYDTSDTAKELLPKLLNTPGIYNTGNTVTAPVGARKMRIVWMRGYGSVYVNGVLQGSYGSESIYEDGGVTINYDYARNLELTVSAGSTVEITGNFTFLQYWFYSSLDSGIILRNSTSAVWLDSTEHIIRSTISTSLFNIPNATRVSVDSLRSLLINSSVPQDAELYLDATTVNQIVLDGVAIDITKFKITETGISYMITGVWHSLGLFDASGEDYSTLSAILTVLAEKGRLMTKSLEPKTQDCDIGLESNRYNHIYVNSIIPTMNGESTKTGSAVVKETYINGTSGYRIWTDGYCEQWGRVSVVYSSSTYITSTSFIKTFADANYCFVYSTQGITSDAYASNVNSTSETGFSIRNRGGGSYNLWKACGYLAEGQY